MPMKFKRSFVDRPDVWSFITEEEARGRLADAYKDVEGIITYLIGLGDNGYFRLSPFTYIRIVEGEE